MALRTVRNFGKVRDAVEIPDMVEIQKKSYGDFLQEDTAPTKRKCVGLEALFREVFPIENYDKTMSLEYLYYELEKPRYSPTRCRQLRLTYGYPIKLCCRLRSKEGQDLAEQAMYLGEMPIMIGGGEFIINGAERVIVSQLHRSPGVDFIISSKEGDRVLHSGRIIPERGSWIEITVTKKDVLVIKIDQSGKIPATIFLRAIDPAYGQTENILRFFYTTKTVAKNKLTAAMWSVGTIVDTQTGEIIVKAGRQIGDKVSLIRSSGNKAGPGDDSDDSKSETQGFEVIEQVRDPIILNTLAEDDCQDHEQALLKFYMRLRPGNPPNQEKAKSFFAEKFSDVNRYRLGNVGRFRLNRKFEQKIDEKEMTLKPEDFLNTMKYIMALRNNEGMVDDIDHLGNRRLRKIDELAADEIRKGLLKLRKTVQERMSAKRDSDEPLRVADLINSKSMSSSVNYFFGRGELSQIVDQTNALSQLTHERRLSALGPGGLNRRRAGFEVRDVHISHYGRICPIETPEGTNIGLIASLAIFAMVDEYGFLLAPYRRIKNGKVTDEVEFLRADEEMKAIFAPPSTVDPESGMVRKGLVLARKSGELAQVSSDEVDYVDISPKQIVGLSASLIPFLEHDDANRALMGSNMQRQAVPLLRTELPLVGTGMEEIVGKYSSMVVRAEKAGTVTAVDATRIVINNTDEYELAKFFGLNERTCLNQKPIVRPGEKVSKGQVIADGGGTADGVLALGKNILVGFVSFDGFNFEDAIIVSEKLVKNDSFTSIHIDEFTAEVRETRLGKEEFTRDIPNVSEKALRNLDEYGVIREGTRVCPGDILVGKVVPKSKTELTPEEKLLHAIFGRAGEDVKNDSLELPSGYEGVVIKTERFTRRGAGGEEAKKQLADQLKQYEKQSRAEECRIFRQMIEEISKKFDKNVPQRKDELAGHISIVDPTTRQKVGASADDDVIYEQIENFNIKWVKPASIREDVQKIVNKFWIKITELQNERKRSIEILKHGDELPSGVLQMVKIYVVAKRTLSIGDKMAGRHGNKGVIAKIMPEEDMPFLEDGTALGILLNPLGVPSRMNVGQILETHLGWVAKVLGFNAITPVFDGATEDNIQTLTAEANEVMSKRAAEIAAQKQVPPDDEFFVNVPQGLKTQLYDGRTGEPFDQKATIGYIYMMKLHHLVDDKIHARATGPYSLITQQPLGGKARTGGQRFGEMEVWALEGYGAAYTLQEMLTVKSDDVEGRTKIYESMVKGTNTLEAGTPLSFDVLCNEIRGLGLNIQLEKKRLGTVAL
jgi:DNA-directed RNA polymerase subunit beta